MQTFIPTLPPDHQDVPEPLTRLLDLAYNLWWTWHREARALFDRIDPDLWSRYRNPVRVLMLARRAKLAELATDSSFLAELGTVLAHFDADTAGPADFGRPVAYVSAEYALHESLPIYSGGLGVLSGDHLKEAADMNLPLLGVGLFYRRGYFRQIVDAEGWQQHHYPDLDAMRLPLLRVRGPDGDTLRVNVELGDRNVSLRAWCAFVGHVPLLLLDSFTTHNPPEDRFITSQLYVRGRDMRLEQELVLGRGAVAVLQALGIRPRVWHMNEGHSAFLALENVRRRHGIGRLAADGQSLAPAGTPGGTGLQAAIEECRPLHVFTTHTPVPAGNEVFARDRVRPYLQATARELGVETDALLALGEASGNGFEPGFNLTALALRLSARANGVSQLHGRVSRDMWRGYEIGAITNGVHVPTWLGREMARVLRAEAHDDPFELARRAGEVDDAVLWAAHVAQKHRLMRFVRVRTLRQAARHGHSPAVLRHIENLLNPSALTLGFARRFAPYKRADLLFSDPARLERLLCDGERPVQLIMAGKAHPADRAGQEIIRRIFELAGGERIRGRIVFVEDYDLATARLMVRGVDAWLNTPTWPLEASGTSGMKAAANGVINVSVPDGWWAEAYAPGLGYSIGDQRPPDGRDADILLGLIEQQLVPQYYERGPEGLPRRWIAMMRASMVAFLGRFSTRRMLRDYSRELYGLELDGSFADAPRAALPASR
ncbi:MAG TPA: alpha-glucan family phosphorylase [Planctomycetota bacterium]|nr:alpha-glucan family phosphorylase [Planctomycetota bacterium]